NRRKNLILAHPPLEQPRIRCPWEGRSVVPDERDSRGEGVEEIIEVAVGRPIVVGQEQQSIVDQVPLREVNRGNRDELSFYKVGAINEIQKPECEPGPKSSESTETCLHNGQTRHVIVDV